MQISAANSRAGFESRASKLLVTNRTLSYSAHVSGTRKIWYQKAWHMSKFTGTTFWYQKLGWRTWIECHGPKGYHSKGLLAIAKKGPLGRSRWDYNEAASTRPVMGLCDATLG